MIYLVDNYDSFTYNLVQFIGELGADPRVRRNDALGVEEIAALEPRGVIISPGPGRPEDAGVSVELVRELGPRVPILGVCLGHQAIALAHGGQIVRAPHPIHGKSHRVNHRGGLLFDGVPNPFSAGRYHSLIVAHENFPGALEVQAETGDNLIMGIQHREHPSFGVQFHPESILTEEGKTLLENFLRFCGEIS